MTKLKLVVTKQQICGLRTYPAIRYLLFDAKPTFQVSTILSVDFFVIVG